MASCTLMVVPQIADCTCMHIPYINDHNTTEITGLLVLLMGAWLKCYPSINNGLIESFDLVLSMESENHGQYDDFTHCVNIH